MKIIDISMTISPSMQVYKNREAKVPKISIDSDHETGHVHESRLDMNLHTGTHVDAPLHMIAQGEKLEIYNLDQFIGPALVLDLSQVHRRVIEKEDLESFSIQDGDIVILKTANSSSDVFEFDFVYLSGEGASYLASCGVKAVGIDALGIERDAPDHPTHRVLLEKNIPIIEGLRLGHVNAGRYEFVGLPIKLDNVEAAPLRAILIER